MQTSREIFLKAKKNIFNSKFGLNESLLKGDGLDFREIKEYENEDLRRINWKSTAKSGSLKTNVFNETKQMNIVFIFLLSGGLNFGSFKLKIELGAEILGLIGLNSIYQKNSFHTMFLSQKYEKFYLNLKDEVEIYDLIQKALNFEILGKSVDFDSFELNKYFSQKAAVFVVSDFLDDIDLSKIAFKNDVYALILRDKFEENLDIISDLDFIDASNFKSFELNLTKSSIKKYQEILKAHDEKMIEHFLENKINFGKIYTDEDAILSLLRIVRA
ncbi:DUF58 domain-containing protein [Campylobacter sp. FMV-PI01]|uniref:DUF58 domain-containing protein n=1 Tax=Campylobacter portucalensis TaxID=2608384 RepID=A0A6L5WIB1_9BACT|nr:DUF58 domain-containing protein [Campylobacter portucalensis]MSN96950.1 DUF58 domain-containing protein [Campylobacter portucalensis]